MAVNNFYNRFISVQDSTGGSKDISDRNLNEIFTDGAYEGLNCLNSPIKGYIKLIVTKHTDDWIIQEIQVFNNDVYLRAYQNGKWYEWQKVDFNDDHGGEGVGITVSVETKPHTHDVATNETKGFMSNIDKIKIDGIEEHANNYTHPETHSADMIRETDERKFVTNAQLEAIDRIKDKDDTLNDMQQNIQLIQASNNAISESMVSVTESIRNMGISPKTYGAISWKEDSTFDNSSIFQNIIDELSNSEKGGVILIDDVYGISNTINLKPKVSIISYSQPAFFNGRTYFKSDDLDIRTPRLKANKDIDGAILSFENTDGTRKHYSCCLRNIILDCNKFANNGIKIIGKTNARQEDALTIENVCISAAKSHGLMTKETLALKIINLNVSACGGYGCYFNSGTCDSVILNPYIHTNEGGGIYIGDGSSYLQIQGGKIEDNYGSGIQGYNCSEIIINGTQFHRNNYYNILAAGSKTQIFYKNGMCGSPNLKADTGNRTHFQSINNAKLSISSCVIKDGNYVYEKSNNGQIIIKNCDIIADLKYEKTLNDTDSIRINNIINSNLIQSINLSSNEINVLSFQCDDGEYVLGNGEHDDTTGIQRALDYCFENNKGLVFPEGKYKITKSLNAHKLVSIRGIGSKTQFYISNFPLFEIETDENAVTTEIKNFYVQGTGKAGSIAVNFKGGNNRKNIHYGYFLKNIDCYNLDTAIKAISIWHSTFENINTTACYNGIILLGQCVDNNIIRPTYVGNKSIYTDVSSIDKTTKRTGIGIYGYNYTEKISGESSNYFRPESIKINSPYIAKADYGVYVSDCLLFNIDNFDIDYIYDQGIVINNYDGNSNISNGSIYLSSNALNCIATTLKTEQYANKGGKLLIQNVQLGAWEDTDITSNSTALRIDNYNNNVDINNITVNLLSSGKFFRGIWASMSDDITINSCKIDETKITNSVIRLEQCNNVSLINTKNKSTVLNCTYKNTSYVLKTEEGFVPNIEKEIDCSTWKANEYNTVISEKTLIDGKIYLLKLVWTGTNNPKKIIQTALIPVTAINNSKTVDIVSNYVSNQNDGTNIKIRLGGNLNNNTNSIQLAIPDTIGGSILLSLAVLI